MFLNTKDYEYIETQYYYDDNNYGSLAPCRLIDLPEKGRMAKKEKAGLQASIFKTIEPLTGTKEEKATKYLSMAKLGDLILESDEPEAILYSRKMIEYLENEVRIPPESILFAFSGSKSIHITVAAECFGVSPSADLHLIYKNIVNTLMEKTGTIFDKSIYSNRRMFRVINSLRPGTEFYKIPITREELFTIDTKEEFQELAKAPRQNFKRTIYRPFPHIHEAFTLYQDAKRKLKESRKIQSEQEINLTQKDVRINLSGKETPPCIKHLLTYGPPEYTGGRHDATLFHITYCKAKGMSREECLKQVLSWNEKFHSKAKPGELKKEIKTQIKTIYRGQNYKFRCKGWIKTLCLSCNDSCPLYSKVDPAKKKLKEIPLEEAREETPWTIEEAREEIEYLINTKIQERELKGIYSFDKNLLLKVPPGVGKSTIALKVISKLKEENDNRRYIYCHPLSDHLEELLKKGELDPAIWRIIYGRKQIKKEYEEGEKQGNCYYADKFNELRPLRIPSEKLNNMICGNCQHQEECKSCSWMYQGQWHTTKNLAMTHTMYANAGLRALSTQNIDYAVIDEDIHSQLIEKIEVKKDFVKEAIKDANSPAEEALFKSLWTCINDLEAKGENTTLTGNSLLKSFTKAFKIHSTYQTIEDLEQETFFFVKDDKGYHWKEDFYKVLQQEVKHRKEHGENFNSCMYLKYHEKHKNIQIYFFNKKNLPDFPAFFLDATGEEEIYKTFIPDIEVEEIKVKKPADMEVIQIINGRYGKSYQKDNEVLQDKFKKILNLLEEDDVFVSGWRETGEKITEQDFKHFYGLRGTNKYEGKKAVVILGTPNIRPEHLQEEARVLFQNSSPLDFTIEKILKSYDCEIRGKNYGIETPISKDKRVQSLLNISREAEVNQAAHRIRPLLEDGKKIYLITSLPIPDLEPTKLLTFSELTTELHTKKKINELIKENGGEQKVKEVLNEYEIFLKKQFWTFEKWLNIILEIQKSMDIQQTANYKGKLELSILYNILFLSLTANGKFKETECSSHFPDSEGGRYKVYLKFCKKFNLKSQTESFSYDGRGKKITINFAPRFPGEVLPLEIVKAEYKKFKNRQAAGKLLTLIGLEKEKEESKTLRLKFILPLKPEDFIKQFVGKEYLFPNCSPCTIKLSLL
ncbi:MAG: nucleoside-triphosphatase [Candidatus Margulisbacteria bacterium]|nr:nucleoside-triphosphatase [Candidatus Margulisiibacteriota bacterium]